MPAKESKNSPSSGAITIRLGSLKDRLSTAAEKLDLSENDIGRHAIKALLDAIEANDYTVLWPPKVTVKGDKRVMEI